MVSVGITAGVLGGRFTLPPTTGFALVNLLVWFVLGYAFYSTALGVLAPLAPGQAKRPPTIEDVAGRVGALAQEPSLSEAQRAELTQRWKAVQSLLEVAAAHRAQASVWQAEEADAREIAVGRPSAMPLPTLPAPPAADTSRTACEEALAATRKAAGTGIGSDSEGVPMRLPGRV